jgi:hypothetical protein
VIYLNRKQPIAGLDFAKTRSGILQHEIISIFQVKLNIQPTESHHDQQDAFLTAYRSVLPGFKTFINYNLIANYSPVERSM